MRILVTGAAGFIGSHVTDALLLRGDHVIGVDNFDPFYDPAEKWRNIEAALQNPRFALVEADVADFPTLSSSLASRTFDAVVHLAARPGVIPSFDDQDGYARVNVLGTQAVLELARTRGVRRFVLGSSSSVYGNGVLPFVETAAPAPISPYAETKLAAEQLCAGHQAAHGGSMLVLRFFSVYGPRQRPDLAVRTFFERIAAGRSITLYGDGGTERDYTWVGDIVAGVTAAVDRGSRVADEPQVINLGAGASVSLRDLVALVGETVGREPVVEWQPERRGDVLRTRADLARAQSLLGYGPRVSLSEGLRLITPAAPASDAVFDETDRTPGRAFRE